MHISCWLWKRLSRPREKPDACIPKLNTCVGMHPRRNYSAACMCWVLLCRMAGSCSLLLTLPGECLVGILQCCAADDLHSLFSVARAHSRLHQAAVTALRTMTVAVSQQQQMDGVWLVFLGKHSKHIDSLHLSNRKWRECPHPRIVIRQLPSNLQLSSMKLQWLDLQLQPGDGFLRGYWDLLLRHCQP